MSLFFVYCLYMYSNSVTCPEISKFGAENFRAPKTNKNMLSHTKNLSLITRQVKLFKIFYGGGRLGVNPPPPSELSHLHLCLLHNM